MKKVNSKQVNIKIPKEDAKIVKEILELEKSNVEAHRIAQNGKKETEYEKRLTKIAEEFATQ